MATKQSTRPGARQMHLGVSRRALVAAGLTAVAAPAVLRAIPANAQSRVIKIGHVSPRTGPLAGFGEADPYILGEIQKILEPGIASGGKTYKVQIISKDSQSNASRAAEVASELILRDKVDLIVAASTPDTTNPVADQAEVNEVPCVTTNCPWQPYFFGRKGDPAKAQSKIIKIGHVSPRTGPLAGFGEADGFILGQVRGLLTKAWKAAARPIRSKSSAKTVSRPARGPRRSRPN